MRSVSALLRTSRQQVGVYELGIRLHLTAPCQNDQTSVNVERMFYIIQDESRRSLMMLMYCHSGVVLQIRWPQHKPLTNSSTTFT